MIQRTRNLFHLSMKFFIHEALTIPNKPDSLKASNHPPSTTQLNRLTSTQNLDSRSVSLRTIHTENPKTFCTAQILIFSTPFQSVILLTVINRKADTPSTSIQALPTPIAHFITTLIGCSPFPLLYPMLLSWPGKTPHF